MMKKVNNIRTEQDVKEFLQETKDVKEFTIEAYTDGVKPSKEIKVCEIGFTTSEGVEHLYIIHKDAIYSLKDFFETKEFETFSGRYVYKALLYYGIKLNITKEYGTYINKQKLKEILNKRNDLMTGIKRIDLYKSLNDIDICEGEYEIENALGGYFGIHVDTEGLNKTKAEYEDTLTQLADEIYHFIGYIDINNTQGVIEAIKHKFNEKLNNLSIRALNKYINTYQKDESKRDLLHLLTIYRRYKLMSNEYKNILTAIDKVIDGKVYPGTTDKCISHHLVDQCLIPRRLVKPTNKYCLVSIDIQNSLVPYLIDKLCPSIPDMREQFMLIASRVFNVERDKLTPEHTLLIKLIWWSYDTGKLSQTAFDIADELKVNVREIANKMAEILKNISVEEIKHTVHEANLPTDIINMLIKTSDNGLYGIMKNKSTIAYMLDRFLLTELRKKIGKTNLRARMLVRGEFGFTYEVARGDLDNFKAIVNSTSIRVGNDENKLIIYDIVYPN